jgi:hypothetical protein
VRRGPRANKARRFDRIAAVAVHPPVLIVGAGSAGLFAACELIRVEPRVVERGAAPNHERVCDFDQRCPQRCLKSERGAECLHSPRNDRQAARPAFDQTIRCEAGLADWWDRQKQSSTAQARVLRCASMNRRDPSCAGLRGPVRVGAGRPGGWFRRCDPWDQPPHDCGIATL